MITRGWEEGRKQKLFNDYRVSDLQDEKVLKIYVLTAGIYQTLLNNNGKDGKYYCFFYISGRIQSHAPKETGTLIQSLRPPSHATH